MKGTVISIIKGGLGNQLFIYAAGRAFSERTGRKHFLDLRRGYTHDEYGRAYRLDKFPITAEIMPEKWRIAPNLKDIRHKLIRSWNKLLPIEQKSYITQQWELPPTQLTKCIPRKTRVTLNGYWQDEAFFNDISEIIRRELTPPAPGDEKNLKLGKEFSSRNMVFVHARRVRYPVLLHADYYREAIRQIQLSVIDPCFAVFSDDLRWARENIDFGESPVRYIEGNGGNELSDLWLMTKCPHAIVANSSFSWWGAWLGSTASKDRIIISPTHPDWGIRPAKKWHCIPV